MNDKSKYPFWVVKRGDYYAKNDLGNNYMLPYAEFTPDLLEAAHFGRDMAKRVAGRHAGARVIKITGSKSAPPKPKRNVHLALVLDNSASMEPITNESRKAFDGILTSTRESSQKTGVATVASLWLAGDARSAYAHNVRGFLSPQVKEILFAHDIGKAHLLHYKPDGGTPLFDAVGNAISRIKESGTSPNTSYLVQVITDGEENQSTKYNANDVNRMIDACQKEGNWTFVFHLPPGKKAAFVRNFSVPEDNIREWERTTQGVRNLEVSTSGATMDYMHNVSFGASATRGFFTADLSKVKPTDVRRACVDVASSLKSHQVPREMAIKDFVEDICKQPYRVGDAFYQLTKDEKIQSDKKILVKEKGKTAIYYGDDARQVLGFPPAAAYSELKIRPGNLSQWDIFIQSNSTNRKLVRGTNVLVLKSGETL